MENPGPAPKHCEATTSPQPTVAKRVTETYNRLPKAKEEKPRRNGETRAFKCALGYWGIEKAMHMPRAGYLLGKVMSRSLTFTTS